jgi:DNA-directed RNA polymerase
LTFAKGKAVEPEDACWLAIHLANVHGVDKTDLDERIQWVEERESQWRAIAADPMEYRQWADEDDAWQCLAAIFEWVDYLDSRNRGEPFVSSLPIRVDGTCNGIQHLSAMIRDEIGGKAVNLIPADKPQDIYMDVAKVLAVLLEEDLEDAEKESYRMRWIELLGGKADRSLTKRPVMILPYGGTQHAYMKYTLEWCKENLSANAFGDKKDKYKMVGFMVTYLWKAVSQTIVRPREVMTWLQDCANKASETGMPLYWRTPTGFIVRQFYGEREMHQIKTNIDGQPTGIAPNFVHSMDASALMECVNLAALNGIDSVTTIHDSYGTVAADMWKLYGCIREAFILTHSEPVLEQFLQACKEVAPDVTDWPALPKFGTLNLEDVRHSDYFFM